MIRRALFVGAAVAALIVAAPGAAAPAGTITEFSGGLTANSGPFGITAGPDGNMWFTQVGDDVSAVARITMKGRITEFRTGIDPNARPWEIATGPDGNLWFTELEMMRIGRITPQGLVTEFSNGITPFKSAPSGITAGPDGNMWFTELGGNRIGRIVTGARPPQHR